MATKPTESAEETSAQGTRLIATYLPGGGHPGFVREITKKQARDGLVVEIDEDLEWNAANNHRVDVTGLPDEFIDYLKKDPAFRVREE
jgi:hypothetical protein